MPNKERTIRILYDGDCPLCVRKMQFLRRRDRNHKLVFSDIRAKGFNALETGVSIEILAYQIHAILPDGSIVSRMDVIRAAYRKIGLGWLVAPTDWPILKPLFDTLYGWVAKHRQQLARLFR